MNTYSLKTDFESAFDDEKMYPTHKKNNYI